MMNNGFSSGEEDSRGGHTDQTCCLIDDNERCRNPAGYASYSKRIQKTVSQKRLKLSSDPTAQHIYICDYHKGRIQSARTKRRRKDSEEDSNETDTDMPEVPDLYQLQVNTLRRYKRHYKVQTRPGMKRAQLADTIMKHFKTIPIKEKEIITYFVYMVKSNANKLDQKNGIGNDTT
ncbi:histone deacetylase complex subunit SAP30 homolog [Teleopsis dalmanni]|uniref:histone deacetylase complex subunit SAP30 homolog n=1 Tax=Teleopsis dalmanni TaxID=139649 RepID=UPI0018CEB003|nr:histone deacetylase complex subunit SAP30 homolog [Teleopsis dalmanni]XP_037943124.1 histone deacetylase complex subunit SAP30 homolog [Teleopsis dalmanni]